MPSGERASSRMMRIFMQGFINAPFGALLALYPVGRRIGSPSPLGSAGSGLLKGVNGRGQMRMNFDPHNKYKNSSFVIYRPCCRQLYLLKEALNTLIENILF
jgi:hypothetical protein